MESATTGRTVAAAPAHLNSVTARGWSVFDARIGALPVPVYLVLLAVLAAMTLKGKLASDLPTGIALVAVGGFTCAELAKRLPWIRHICATSIFAAFIPSMMVYCKLMPVPVVKAVADFSAHVELSNGAVRVCAPCRLRIVAAGLGG